MSMNNFGTDIAQSVSLKKYTNDFFGELLKRSDVNEICYNGSTLETTDENGKTIKKDVVFYQDAKGHWDYQFCNKLDLQKAKSFAQAAASFKQQAINESHPILSCMLQDGERVQIVVAPATAKNKISITIRKPSQTRYKFEDYLNQGLFDDIKEEVKENPIDDKLNEYLKATDYENFIKTAIVGGKNIVIAGETGSGKTTFMKSLIDFIPLDERVITIEDVEELKFYEHKNYVQLFYPSEAKEDDFLNSATLLKSCLRMKPDRILLAELRGGETYDFINVISSGHNGSITSCHAGSVKETFTRLALMTLQNKQGQKLPFNVIEETLKNTIDVVIHMYANKGKRRISEIYFKGAKNEI